MSNRWQWSLFALLALAEFLLFDIMTSRHHAWVYPRWNDQIQYLTECYTGYEYLRQHGFWAGMAHTLSNPAAQGTLHDFFAVLIFCIAGPSRSAALSLNFLAFLAWQGAVFATWSRLAKRWSVAWLGVGLLLCLHVLVDVSQGSPVDFRLDWLACCAVGVVSCLALYTDGLRHTGWTAVWGASIGIAILIRFVTTAYFGVMFAALLGMLLLGLICSKQKAHTGARVLRLILAGAVAAAISLPFLWHNRDWVLNYYWIGHLTGPESAIRSPQFGILRSLAFVFGESLWRLHLGLWFVSAASVSLVGLAIAVWLKGKPSAQPDTAGRNGLGYASLMGAILLLIPAAILVLHSQKSLHVESVLVPGLLTILLTIATAFVWRIGNTSRFIPVVIASGTLLVGVLHFTVYVLRYPHSPEFTADARKVNQLADYLYSTARLNGLVTPNLGVDQITDCLDGQIMRVICYERHRQWVPFMMTLPTGIAEENESILWERLQHSDFMLVTDEPGVQGFWPYDQQMRRLYPAMKGWCDANLQLVESFRLLNRQMTLYQRQDIPFAPVRH